RIEGVNTADAFRNAKVVPDEASGVGAQRAAGGAVVVIVPAPRGVRRILIAADGAGAAATALVARERSIAGENRAIEALVPEAARLEEVAGLVGAAGVVRPGGAFGGRERGEVDAAAPHDVEPSSCFQAVPFRLLRGARVHAPADAHHGKRAVGRLVSRL